MQAKHAKLPRACEDLVRNIYYYFNHSSKRYAQFQEFQGLAEVQLHKLLHPAQTRWLSVTAAVQRIVEQWAALQLYFDSKQKERLLSVDTICRDLRNPLIKLILLFLCWVLPKITNMNAHFQHAKVVLTDVHQLMTSTYKDLLRSFLNNDYVNQTPLDLIDPANSSKFLIAKSMYFGLDVVSMLQNEEIASNKPLLDDFYQFCRNFLITLCRSISQRYNFEDDLLKEVACLSPVNALS